MYLKQEDSVIEYWSESWRVLEFVIKYGGVVTAQIYAIWEYREDLIPIFEVLLL